MSEDERPDILLKRVLTASPAQRPAEMSGHPKLASAQIAPRRPKVQTKATSVQRANSVRPRCLIYSDVPLTRHIDRQEWFDQSNAGPRWEDD
jgi:hypothetical protein